METTEKYVPMPPKVVGREFVRQFYTLMNKAPEYLYRFYGEDAKFIYDDLNPVERRTVQAVGKWEIRDIMSERIPNFKHTSTKVHTFDTIDTLDQGLLVQVYGEISFNEQPMRTFSQSVILIPTSPFRYYVQNDIFRFCDYESDGSENQGSVTGPATPPMQPDWGTQCEEEDIEPYDGQTAQQAEPRAYSVHHVGVDDDGPENEVKLDTSDSGLSSDAEKVIMDIQSHNLKSILQEQRAITKETVKNRGATPPIHTENEAAAAETDAKPVDEANRTQLFRDSCILTVGNVINPNVEFSDDTKRDEIASLENERAQESVDTFNASKSDDNNSSSGKLKYRKRKDKKSKARQEMMSKEKSLVESVDANQLPVESKPVTEETIAVPVAAAAADVVVKKEIATPEHTVEKSTPIEHKPSEPTPTSQTAVPPSPPQPEQETPKSIPEMKTYADLAKAGTAEWIDELAQRRGSTDRNRTRPTLVRRSSRTEKTTPSQGKPIFRVLEFLFQLISNVDIFEHSFSVLNFFRFFFLENFQWNFGFFNFDWIFTRVVCFLLLRSQLQQPIIA